MERRTAAVKGRSDVTNVDNIVLFLMLENSQILSLKSCNLASGRVLQRLCSKRENCTSESVWLLWGRFFDTNSLGWSFWRYGLKRKKKKKSNWTKRLYMLSPPNQSPDSSWVSVTSQIAQHTFRAKCFFFGNLSLFECCGNDILSWLSIVIHQVELNFHKIVLLCECYFLYNLRNLIRISF